MSKVDIKQLSKKLHDKIGIGVHFLDRHDSLVFIIYVFIFVIILFGMRNGAGQYWDWNFPYFQNEIVNIFSRASSSWVTSGLGEPLSYSSDFYARFVISRITFIQPEHLLYALYVAIFSLIAHAVYLISKPKTSRSIAFLIGLAACINPAIFYKFMAGHLNYLMSFAIFVWLIWYMLYRYRKSWHSAIVVALLFGFIGMQIQFFVIAGLFLFFYSLFNREKIRISHVLLIILATLLINFVWVSNFVFGANDISQLSDSAAKVSFKSTNSASFSDIFKTAFSKATQIWRLYSPVELLASFAILVVMIYLIIRQKVNSKTNVLLLVYLVAIIYLATGLFQQVPIPIVSKFYPMFREVGHFAPIILLVSLLLIGNLSRGKFKIGIALTCLLLIGVSGVKFSNNLYAINFSNLRSKFISFEPSMNLGSDIKSDSRVLSYPFFGQYSISDSLTKLDGTYHLNNSGHDSYIAYSGYSAVKNSVRPEEFDKSIQYRFLQDYDVDILKNFGIKYIFDFSNIYESNYNLFVPRASYHDDLSLIKNDPNFMQNVISRNGDKVKRINEHIIEINSDTKMVSASERIYSLEEGTNPDQALRLFNRARQEALLYTTDANANIAGRVSSILVSESVDIHDGEIIQNYTNNFKRSTLYVDNHLVDLSYTYEGKMLTLYTKMPTGLSINGKSVPSQDKRIIKSMSLDGGEYTITAGSHRVLVSNGDTDKKVATVKAGDEVGIYKLSSTNFVKNGSFEEGLWQKVVGDCNNYDDSGVVKMELDQDASEGGRSLTLLAKRHDACTSSDIKLEAEKSYLFSYDAKGDGAISSYYFDFGRNTQPIRGDNYVDRETWTTQHRIIKTPSDMKYTRLFLYARGSNTDNAAKNLYDNVRISPVEKVDTVTVPIPGNQYATADLSSDRALQFSYKDANYTLNNIVRNGNFAEGLWRKNVDDCSKYDSNPDIGMNLVASQEGAGNNVVQLQAKRHTACTYQTVNVNAESTYLLRFKYKTDRRVAGYHIGYNTPDAPEGGERLQDKSNAWQQYTKKIVTPKNVSALTLHLYAYEPEDLKGNSVVQYDDVEIIEIPPIASAYFVVSENNLNAASMEPVLEYRSISSTKRTVGIKGASSAFYLNLKETYSPGWSISGAYNSSGHIKLNDYSNGWLIEPEKFCSDNPHSCKLNNDNTYDLSIDIEFIPQKAFNISMVAGITTSVALIMGLVITISNSRHTNERSAPYNKKPK